MKSDEFKPRIDQIETQWSMVRQAAHSLASADDARRVLALTAGALRRTEEAVLGEVVPALGTIPIRLSPEAESSRKGRNDV